MSGSSVGAALCGAAALLLLGVALRDATVVRQLRRRGTRTRGVVVDNVRVTDDSGPMWVPVIAFTDQQGYRVEFSPRIRGTGMGLPTGREVGVVYLAHNPQTARVLMWRHTVGPVVSLLLGGLVFLGVCVWITVTG